MVSDRALTAQYPANSATAPLVPDGILTMNKGKVAPRSRDSRSVSRSSRSSIKGSTPSEPNPLRWLQAQVTPWTITSRDVRTIGNG